MIRSAIESFKNLVEDFKNELESVEVLIEEGFPEMDIADRIKAITLDNFMNACYTNTIISASIISAIEVNSISAIEAKSEKELAKQFVETLKSSVDQAFINIPHLINLLKELFDKVLQGYLEGEKGPMNRSIRDFFGVISMLSSSIMLIAAVEDTLGDPKDGVAQKKMQDVVAVLCYDAFDQKDDLARNKEYMKEKLNYFKNSMLIAGDKNGQESEE